VEADLTVDPGTQEQTETEDDADASDPDGAGQPGGQRRSRQPSEQQPLVVERGGLDGFLELSGAGERLAWAVAAVAAAPTAEQVGQTLIAEAAAALDATSAGLWLIDPGGAARLAASASPGGPRGLTSADPAPAPVAEAIRTTEAIAVAGFACLPLVTAQACLGAMALTFDGERELDESERRFLALLGRTACAAIERLRRLDGERASRARTELLYKLAAAVIGADRVEDVFDAALDAIAPALGTDRAAVLVHDGDDVMRFRAWRGLSDEYRRTVEGHSPWRRDARDPQPVLVSDVDGDASLAGYQSLFRRERIGALGFIPLVSGGRLLGKFMVYYDRPRVLTPTELEVGRAIANHVAAAVARFRFMGELQETVRFNEMFTGILGHDLRNPLAAIITSARLAMSRDTTDRLRRPLARILNSGDRMTRMIDQLLDFTRVRLGSGIPVAPVEVDLATVIRQVMDELDDANPACALRLSCAGDSLGRWDPDRLSQVFSNLVANAVHHGMAEHGVDVTLDGGAPDVVRIEIKNRGVIPPRRMQTLFEPMAGPARTSASRGLGLGLFITRELVRAHGGSIQVRSVRRTNGSTDEGDGCTAFTIVLPRRLPSSDG